MMMIMTAYTSRIKVENDHHIHQFKEGLNRIPILSMLSLQSYGVAVPNML